MEPIYLSIKQKETGNRILKISSSLTGILLYFRKKYVKYINININIFAKTFLLDRSGNRV